jgi:hypothetical protein
VDFVEGAADHVSASHRYGTVFGGGEAKGQQKGAMRQETIRVFEGDTLPRDLENSQTAQRWSATSRSGSSSIATPTSSHRTAA